MMRFTPQRPAFGRIATGADDEDQDARQLPRPRLLKLRARRAAAIAGAGDVLAILPAAGESLHFLMTKRLDMAQLLDVILLKCGRCEEMVIASLGLNQRAYKTMIRWLDEGMVPSLTLLVSKFFRSHNGSLFSALQGDLRERGQRAAAADCHAKVSCMHFVGGMKFALESSGNLAASGSVIEQGCIIADPEIHDFHRDWIKGMVTRHEGEATKKDA